MITGQRLASVPLTPNRLRGFTLIEMMIAITIGLIVTLAVSQIFVTSRSVYTMEENLARVQENGRFAMQFLTRDIRMAGYAGCSSKLTFATSTGADCPQGKICSIANPANAYTTFDTAGLKGFKHTGSGTTLSDWTPALPSDYFADGEVKAGDVFVIQRADDLDTHLTGNTTPSNANVQILDTSTLANRIVDDDILMVTDCKGGDVFRANSVSTPTGGIVTISHSNATNSQNKLTHAYGNDAQIMKLVSRAYYIGAGASGKRALMRKELKVISGAPDLDTQELVEGVEDMRLAYGEDTDATTDLVPNIYHDPAAVTDWRNVVTMRVGLLARTLKDNVSREGEITKFNLAGNTVGPFNDHIRRRAFNSTIRIRGR
jgi:type IV pilus assembly protein PilW